MMPTASVRKTILDEFEQFRCEILELPKEAVFEQCNRIRFYSYIREYFSYNEHIPKRIMELVGCGAFSISGAWLFYLKHERYRCESWEAISEMILAMYKKRKWRRMKYGSKRLNEAVC